MCPKFIKNYSCQTMLAGAAIFLMCTITLVTLYQQKEYQIELERAEVTQINRKYMKIFKIDNFKLDRHTRVINLTMLYAQDIKDDFKMNLQAYKFASNEYRTFPISLTIYFCDALEKNLFGFANFKDCGNFTECHLKKDIPYVLCNWRPSEEQFPPLVPSGSYKINIKFFIGADYTAIMDIYGKITYKRI